MQRIAGPKPYLYIYVNVRVFPVQKEPRFQAGPTEMPTNQATNKLDKSGFVMFRLV